MKSVICDMLGIEFPLVAFTHCRDVVVEVSKAGGFGVLGAVDHTPESLEIELDWIDEHIDGKPYGVDLIVPTSMSDKGGSMTAEDLRARIPEGHKRHVEELLASNGIDTKGLWDSRIGDDFTENIRESGAALIMDVAFKHPIKMIVNALGVPPRSMLDRAKENGVLTGALTGAREHAIKHADAGVDILVVAGTEAGGHCGEVSTLVLVPEVIESLKEHGADLPVLAAGGIVTGRQMAACMAMGAAGAWTGSVWLTTSEAETDPVIKEKYLAASSRQTVRSRGRTGKYTRQLRSPWTDAWMNPDSPDPLPMPLQMLLSGPALDRVDKLAAIGDPGARQLATYFVGQGVGLMNATVSARTVVYDFMKDFAEASEHLGSILDD
ncbi:MAG: nitronate monooxygenase [Gammaproteobacteria bacterium]|nr:MAG: nitronate monooxygenase [Gammaproteobacteria bacterium]